MEYVLKLLRRQLLRWHTPIQDALLIFNVAILPVVSEWALSRIIDFGCAYSHADIVALGQVESLIHIGLVRKDNHRG